MSTASEPVWRLGEGEQGVVSVIVTAYNQDWVLGQTLESVRKQTYRPIECVIVDDGSSDNTAAKIARFVEAHAANLTLKTLRQTNKGAQAARDAGVKASTGKFIQYLDGDDLLGVDKIRAQVEFLASPAGYRCDVVYGDAKWLHDDGSKVWEGEALGIGPTDDVIVSLLDFSHFNPPFSYLCRRSAVERCRGWDASLKINDDVDYFLRMACRSLQAGQNFAYLPVDAGLYRKHTRPRTSEGGMHLVVKFNTLILKALEGEMDEAGLLTPARRHALAKAYYRVAGWASLIDEKIWREDLAHCKRLEPEFVPESRSSKILQRAVGFSAAERLKRKVRIARYASANAR